MNSASRTLRAFPTMLRVGLADAVAYRAEFVVWALAYTMPIIMLALWSAVAREAPIGRFDEAQFRAYFMATLIVRLCTGAWVIWDINMEVRQGTLQKRLLRPIHPLFTYLAENLSALPMRFIVVLPILTGVLLWLGTGPLSDDAVQLAIIPLSLLGSFVLTFFAMAAIGSLAFFWESSLSVFDLWLGLYTVLSGYVMPLELFPPAWLAVIRLLPFRSQLAFPVENMLGSISREASLWGLCLQWAWAFAFVLLARAIWNAGAKRFGAFGG